MAQPLIAGLPPGLGLWAGCVVRLAAVDPTSGTVRTGVVVSAASITVRNLTPGTPTDLESGLYELIPGPTGP